MIRWGWIGYDALKLVVSRVGRGEGATLRLDFKQNTKPRKTMVVKHTWYPTSTDPPSPARSILLLVILRWTNVARYRGPTLKSPLHQKGSFYTFYIYEGCFFFRRRLPCDKSYRSLCYIDLSSAPPPPFLSFFLVFPRNRKVTPARVFFLLS